MLTTPTTTADSKFETADRWTKGLSRLERLMSGEIKQLIGQIDLFFAKKCNKLEPTLEDKKQTFQ